MKRIAHISDTHIRNLKYHEEYRHVFKQIYDSLKQESPDYIVHTGDLAHTKTQLSPEYFEVASNFLKSLADIAPTIMILGNHDGNLKNGDRQDAVTPIIEALQHPNFTLLKNSGEYSPEQGLTFNVLSVFDRDNWQGPSNDKSINIALYHGAIMGSELNSKYSMDHGEDDIAIFKSFDYAMLGDIHRTQYLDHEQRVWYAGSTVQQNFGESFENHGYVIWDIKERKAEFFNIVNDYGYYTIRMKNGILPNISDIPKYPRLRFITENTTQAQVKESLIEIRKISKIQDYVVIRGDRVSSISNNSRSSTELTKDIRDSEYQSKLIIEHLERNFSDLDKETFSRIRNINRELNRLLPDIEIGRNIKWKPKKFEFSNMFSYGENNVIDFENVKGAIGIFAPNHAGKSAILDALSFCVFDKCSRTKMAAAVINNKKNNFTCKLNFEIDGVDYFIERKAKRKKDGGARVDVDFWMIGEDGNPISLNGE